MPAILASKGLQQTAKVWCGMSKSASDGRQQFWGENGVRWALKMGLGEPSVKDKWEVLVVRREDVKRQ